MKSPGLMSLFQKMDWIKTVEFFGLNEGEKQQGQELKVALGKLELNMETLSVLFKNPTQMKKVLAQKEASKRGWSDYLSQHLSHPEIEELKKSQQLKAEQIVEMLLTKIPNS